MDIMTACLSDVGIRREINQDSVLIEKAKYGRKTVLLAAVCDGLGGLQKGEAASAALVRSMSCWFRRDLPELMRDGLKEKSLQKNWRGLIAYVNTGFAEYGRKNTLTMGTTCTAVLVVGKRYYLMNIGDSRTYLLSGRTIQLTRDQTWCEREIACGRMTPEEARTDPRRGILLQCVGAGTAAEPEFFSGTLRKKQCMLLCSDGFFRRTRPEEMYAQFNGKAAGSSEDMQHSLERLVEKLKARKETDNISAVLLKAV